MFEIEVERRCGTETLYSVHVYRWTAIGRNLLCKDAADNIGFPFGRSLLRIAPEPFEGAVRVEIIDLVRTKIGETVYDTGRYMSIEGLIGEVTNKPYIGGDYTCLQGVVVYIGWKKVGA